MKKNFLTILMLTMLTSVLTTMSVLAMPTPGGKATITDSFPSTETRRPIPTEQIQKTENIKNPLPTNKWFNSIAYNQHNKHSLRMYLYPQNAGCQSDGLVIGYSKNAYSKVDIRNDYWKEGYGYKHWNSILISACLKENDNKLSSSNTALDDYSDWSATAKWTHTADTSKWMKATFGQGFLFTYFEFSDGLKPALLLPYDWNYGDGYFFLYDNDDDNPKSESSKNISDHCILQVHLNDADGGRDLFYGIFLPSESSITLAYGKNGLCSIKFDELPYMSVALLPSKTLAEAKQDLAVYYKYAYNFVSKTEASLNVSSDYRKVSTNFKFSFNSKRDGEQFEKNKTIFTLLKHQHKNSSASSDSDLSTDEFKETLRGTLKIATGGEFSTSIDFCGIVPFFDYNVSEEAKEEINKTLKSDGEKSLVDPNKNETYHCGKYLAKKANLIPVAENMKKYDKYKIYAEETKANACIKVMNELVDWFTASEGEDKKYFVYDNIWGGLIGIPNAYESVSFGTEKYNDHHFHYGYFIYSAALLAIYGNEFDYTKNFVKDYGGMVELLIKDIANTKRDDKDFPYMRNFDFYDSHSWANGMGGNDNFGVDLESSSEAMNAWSAIYMWGIATQNEEYIKLGMYLYANEYQAIKNYFFDIDEEILKAPFESCSVSTLFAGALTYEKLWWVAANGAREYKGIQLLPMTPAMLYTGYDKTYAKKFYEEMEQEMSSHSGNKYYWNDVWTRFQSLYDPASAWTNFNNHHNETTIEIDDGGTASYTYHFIDFFRQNGTPIERTASSISAIPQRSSSVSSKITADMPSYLVTVKDDGTPVYSVYNYTNSNKTVRFYNGGDFVGSFNVPAKTFAQTSKLITNADTKTVSVYPIPYKPGSSGRYDAQGITFTNLKENAEIKIFNIAGELVFETRIGNDDIFVWNAKNNSGNKVASGVYIYYIKNGDQTVKGKLAIER